MSLFNLLFLLSTVLPSTVYAYPSYARRGMVTPGGSTIPLRRAAVPYTSQFTYTGAILNGGAGTGIGGIPVPAPGDYEHYFQNPPPGAQRGPCPGLNALANHGFLSRDGITTYDELVAGLQNVYNVEWSAAVVLTVLGISLDGDPVTEMLSIGGDATYQTGMDGDYTGFYGGLSHHGTFELDASLTRNDFYIAGNSYTFNASRFKEMVETVATTSSAENPLFNMAGMALYRSNLYETSKATNPYFYFPELILHNYGAATFLYNAFPSSNRNNTPDLPTISSFFGAVPLPNGEYASQPERIPANWTNRVTPMTITDILDGINGLYAAYPKAFGGNYGVGNWVSLTSTAASNSTRTRKRAGGLTACAVASEFNSITQHAPDPIAMAEFVVAKLDPVFGPLGCNVTINGLLGIS